jgi:hypothetical protein
MCRPLESFTYHADLLLKSAGLSRSDGQGKDVVGRPLTLYSENYRYREQDKGVQFALSLQSPKGNAAIWSRCRVLVD